MFLTILTPTYNRGYLLERLYASLCRQEDQEFEWIVVDDGSTDNTKELVRKWGKETSFPIRYFFQENQGKHCALNFGVSVARADFTFVIDSDDYLAEQAVTKICGWIELIKNEKKYAGVSGTKQTPEGKLIGGFPSNKSYVDATDIMRRKMGLEGDKAEVYRTSLLRQYPFPVFPGEKFLSECAVWNRIGMDGYFIRWYPDTLVVCEYREDGLTKTPDKEKNNYCGYTYVIKQQLEYETWQKRLALIAQYDRVTKLRGNLGENVCENLGISAAELQIARCAKWIHTFIKRAYDRN